MDPPPGSPTPPHTRAHEVTGVATGLLSLQTVTDDTPAREGTAVAISQSNETVGASPGMRASHAPISAPSTEAVGAVGASAGLSASPQKPSTGRDVVGADRGGVSKCREVEREVMLR